MAVPHTPKRPTQPSNQTTGIPGNSSRNSRPFFCWALSHPTASAAATIFAVSSKSAGSSCATFLKTVTPSASAPRDLPGLRILYQLLDHPLAAEPEHTHDGRASDPGPYPFRPPDAPAK